MPVISMFYGIIVRMFFMDNRQHKAPHIHAEYGDYVAVIGIPDGNIIEGNFPNNKLKLLQAWIEIHQDELMADWKLSIEGQKLFKIKGLE